MTDETNPPFEEKPSSSTTTTVHETTRVTGKPRPEETIILNASGRFWIALVMALGLVFVTVAIVIGKATLETNVAITVYTNFLGVASAILGLYLGQGLKPKSQT